MIGWSGELDADLMYTWIVNSATEDGLDQAMVITESCQAEHLDEVQSQWIQQNLRTPAEIDEYFAEAADCLRKAGVEVPETPDNDTVNNLIMLNFLSTTCG